MSKKVTFQLGPATGLSARQLTITRMRKAGDDDAITPEVDTDVGPVTTSTQTIPSNQIYEVTLVDTASAGGATSDTDTLKFQTGSLQFPGPRSDDRLQIQSMEDISSSSSSSSPSSHSSSSWSSGSSSPSSISTSSVSSVSSSASSISTSSVSSASSESSSASSVSSASSESSSASSVSSASSESSSASSASSSSWSSPV